MLYTHTHTHTYIYVYVCVYIYIYIYINDILGVLQWISVYCGCNYIYAVTGDITGSSACFIIGSLELENFIAATLHTHRPKT